MPGEHGKRKETTFPLRLQDTFFYFPKVWLLQTKTKSFCVMSKHMVIRFSEQSPAFLFEINDGGIMARNWVAICVAWNAESFRISNVTLLECVDAESIYGTRSYQTWGQNNAHALMDSFRNNQFVTWPAKNRIKTKKISRVSKITKFSFPRSWKLILNARLTLLRIFHVKKFAWVSDSDVSSRVYNAWSWVTEFFGSSIKIWL